MPITFCPIASGSSGNCIYVGKEDGGLLIDAGLAGKRIQSGLSAIGVDPASLRGVLITHEHSDHISGAGILSRRFNLPIYAAPNTWRFMRRHNTLGKIAEENVRVIEPDMPTEIGGFTVKGFDIPHDASQPTAYSIFTGKYKLTVATDIGHVTDSIRENVRGSDVLLLESNHDIEMLRNGRYPAHLKRRVEGAKGHLSNVTAGQLITEILTDNLKYVFLGHLSEENNRPLIAMDTVRTILESNNVDCSRFHRFAIAHRDVASEPICLED